MSCKQTTFSLVFVKTPMGKRLKSQAKKVVAKSTGVIGLKVLLNEQLMPQEFQAPVSRGYGKRKLTLVGSSFFNSQYSFFVKRFFQNHGGFIAV